MELERDADAERLRQGAAFGKAGFGPAEIRITDDDENMPGLQPCGGIEDRAEIGRRGLRHDPETIDLQHIEPARVEGRLDAGEGAVVSGDRRARRRARGRDDAKADRVETGLRRCIDEGERVGVVDREMGKAEPAHTCRARDGRTTSAAHPMRRLAGVLTSLHEQGKQGGAPCASGVVASRG